MVEPKVPVSVVDDLIRSRLRPVAERSLPFYGATEAEAIAFLETQVSPKYPLLSKTVRAPEPALKRPGCVVDVVFLTPETNAAFRADTALWDAYIALASKQTEHGLLTP